MTYREKFTASEERAHYQIIAKKILREMTELRSKAASSTTSPRRWIWELIQNAKDVHGGQRVKVEVTASLDGEDAHVTFKHNGLPFSAENIRFLIEQISTKDRTKDESGRQKTTGKFGTGFLTTHLLSETVFVRAVVKEPGLDYRQFTLVLDRRGDDLETITEAVRKAKNSMEQINTIEPYGQYIEGAFNTEFRYPLSDDLSRKTATNGLADFVRCNPVVREKDICAAVPCLASPSVLGLSRGPMGSYGYLLINSERKRFEDALRQTQGNRDGAAKLLGLSRATYFRRAKELGLKQRGRFL